MSNAARITLYVVSGFFVYASQLLAFFSDPQVGSGKYVLMLVFLLPAIAALWIGLAGSQYANWQNDAGWVLVGGSLATASVALSFACILATPEIEEMYPGRFDAFSDYLVGFATLAATAAIGGLLLWQASLQDKASD